MQLSINVVYYGVSIRDTYRGYCLPKTHHGVATPDLATPDRPLGPADVTHLATPSFIR